MKGGSALSTFSDRDSAREETPRHATHGSQMVHLTVREGARFFCLPRVLWSCSTAHGLNSKAPAVITRTETTFPNTQGRDDSRS